MGTVATSPLKLTMWEHRKLQSGDLLTAYSIQLCIHIQGMKQARGGHIRPTCGLNKALLKPWLRTLGSRSFHTLSFV